MNSKIIDRIDGWLDRLAAIIVVIFRPIHTLNHINELLTHTDELRKIIAEHSAENNRLEHSVKSIWNASVEAIKMHGYKSRINPVVSTSGDRAFVCELTPTDTTKPTIQFEAETPVDALTAAVTELNATLQTSGPAITDGAGSDPQISDN